MQRQQFSQAEAEACRECFTADQWRAMELSVARFWRDFDELRQCGVARWLETKWVSFGSFEQMTFYLTCPSAFI